MRTLLALLVGAVLGIAGCRVSTDVGGREDRNISADHHHHDECGHYLRSGRWYHVENHRHGPHCGHVYRNGVWVSID